MKAAIFTAILIAAIGIGRSAGNEQKGANLFTRRCTGCHALDNEKIGPRLRGVFGRPAGAVPNFPYSDATKKAKIVWDEATLEKWLADPDQLVPGNDMTFRLESAEERADIIAYLKALPKK